MYFYVYLQAEMFEEAAADGEDAIQNLTGILNGFLQNCLLAVFEDDRWNSAVKEKLEAWPETMSRRRIMSILVQFIKRNRLLYCLVPDYNNIKPDLDCVFDQAISASLDLILVTLSNVDRIAPDGVEVAARRTYQNTIFEPKRSNLAVYGSTCGAGAMGEIEFMKYHFAKAIRHASVIQICDRICGRLSFRENFRYTTRRFIAWIGGALINPAGSRIIFHFGRPAGHGDQYVLDEISELKNGPLRNASFELHFYEESTPEPDLPHQRFILTDQIALNIERGLDFLDGNTQRCRDTYINHQDPNEAQKLLDSFSSKCVATHTI